LNLGLGVDVSFRGASHADGIAALLRQRSLAFHSIQLLPAAAVIESGAREGYLGEAIRCGRSERRTQPQKTQVQKNERGAPFVFF
jgi:hypothetical protein